MCAGKRRAWQLAVVAALLLGAPALRAEAPAAAKLTLGYVAPAGCPDRGHFEARLRARLPSFEASGDGARLEVQIVQHARGASAELSLDRPGASRALRRIDAATCAEAAEALSLVAALMLDPAVYYAERPAERAPRVEKAPSVSAEESSPPAPAAPDPVVPAPTPAASEPPAQLERPALREPPARERPTAVSLHAASLLASGVAPEPRFGARLGASVAQPYAARLTLLAGLGMRMVRTYRSEREQGVVSMAWWSGSGVLCAGTTIGTRGALHGCLAGELGRLRARGSRTAEPASSDRLWSALGAGARARFQLWGPLSLESSLTALFPLLRHRYLLAEGTVHSVPRLTFRLELGVAVQIH